MLLLIVLQKQVEQLPEKVHNTIWLLPLDWNTAIVII